MSELINPHRVPISTPFERLEMYSAKDIKKRGYYLIKIRFAKFTKNDFDEKECSLSSAVTGGRPKKYKHKTKKGGAKYTKVEVTTNLEPNKGIDELKKQLEKNHAGYEYYVREIVLKHIETGKLLYFERKKSIQGSKIMSLILQKIDNVKVNNMLESEAIALAAGFCGGEHCVMGTPNRMPKARPICSVPIDS